MARTRSTVLTLLCASFVVVVAALSAGCSGTIGPVAITEMACTEPEGVMEQETAFMEFITQAQTFRITGKQLQIFRPDGKALTFALQGRRVT